MLPAYTVPTSLPIVALPTTPAYCLPTSSHDHRHKMIPQNRPTTLSQLSRPQSFPYASHDQHHTIVTSRLSTPTIPMTTITQFSQPQFPSFPARDCPTYGMSRTQSRSLVSSTIIVVDISEVSAGRRVPRHVYYHVYELLDCDRAGWSQVHGLCVLCGGLSEGVLCCAALCCAVTIGEGWTASRKRESCVCEISKGV